MRSPGCWKRRDHDPCRQSRWAAALRGARDLMAGASPQRKRRRSRFGSSLEREIDEEFAAHLEHTTQELTAQGIDPRAAREEALRRFGDMARYSISCCEIDHRRNRARRRGELVDEILQDSRFALRLFRRRPVFVAGSLLTMALAVGATAALFTVANSLLLQPLPFPASDRLVQIKRTFRMGYRPRRPSTTCFTGVHTIRSLPASRPTTTCSPVSIWWVKVLPSASSAHECLKISNPPSACPLPSREGTEARGTTRASAGPSTGRPAGKVALR